MKDYSMNLEERKDFILGYKITKDGKIIVKFAKGKPWIIPYNERNEQIVLDKMKKQVEKIPDELESKLVQKRDKCISIFLLLFAGSILVMLMSLADMANISGYFILASFAAIPGIFSLIATLRVNSKLYDLRRNKKFLKMEEKLNSRVRSDQNILANVSSKTKKVIKDFPEDKPVFNINSFNFVPFKDLEQIMENDARNERFGFTYDVKVKEQERPKTRKKTR